VALLSDGVVLHSAVGVEDCVHEHVVVLVLFVGGSSSNKLTSCQFLLDVCLPIVLHNFLLINVFSSTLVINLTHCRNERFFDVRKTEAFLKAGNGSDTLESRVDFVAVRLALGDAFESRNEVNGQEHFSPAFRSSVFSMP